MNPLLLAVVGVSFWYLIFVKQNERLKGPPAPPGPPGWPIVGNLFDINSNTILQDIRRLRQKYGDIFKLRIGSQDIIVVNGYENLREVFVTRADDVSDRPANFLNKDIMHLSGMLEFIYVHPFFESFYCTISYIKIRTIRSVNKC